MKLNRREFNSLLLAGTSVAVTPAPLMGQTKSKVVVIGGGAGGGVDGMPWRIPYACEELANMCGPSTLSSSPAAGIVSRDDCLFGL